MNEQHRAPTLLEMNIDHAGTTLCSGEARLVSECRGKARLDDGPVEVQMTGNVFDRRLAPTATRHRVPAPSGQVVLEMEDMDPAAILLVEYAKAVGIEWDVVLNRDQQVGRWGRDSERSGCALEPVPGQDLQLVLSLRNIREVELPSET